MKKRLAAIEAQLDTKIVSHRGLSVGFGLEGLRITLADGREAAVKAASRASGNLALEGWMLRHLAENSGLPVPDVYFCDEHLLVMEWIPSGGALDAAAQQHGAELLADLHARPFPCFGLERDTLIGPLHQPNPQTASWIAFFRDHRLLYMASEAQREGRLPGSYLDRLEKLAARLEDHIFEPPHPSLLHGDIWGGNVIAGKGRINGFIDPAIYCGHPEIELAFTTMFNTFGPPFFDAYNAVSPLAPGFFEERRDIYNLYPTLVHVRLFGASYLPPINHTLSRLGL